MRTFAKLLATMLFCCLVFASVAQKSMDYKILIEELEFRPGVTIDINVNVYVNENVFNNNNHEKIFAVEGMIHTANCWKPFAEALFANGPQGAHISEFFAIDMPGRGGSGLPKCLNGTPFLLEHMYIEDFVSVISGAIAYLNKELDIHPTTIMGHSLGGLEVIALQDKLVAEGTNMRSEFGIKSALLLSPAIPGPLNWDFINGPGADALAAFARYVPGRGLMLDVPCNVWPFLFFTNTCCYFAPDVVPGAPTPAEVRANGYCCYEPVPLVYQIAGRKIPPELPYPYRPRVTAEANIFSSNHGVKLTIIADEFDKMMNPVDELTLYQYLTRDQYGRRFVFVEGKETCHDTHMSDPNAIVSLLNKPNYFKSEEMLTTIEESNVEFIVYPNPSTGQLVITYNLPDNALVNLKVYSILGQEVAVIQQETQSAGNYTVDTDLSALKSGLYMVKLDAGEVQSTTKLIVR